ncbi:mitochondrial ribosomal protein [Grosmannia clavigera kw1407]|uniref:Small ribosomal subunit protein mS29 n=1 Tax=Grosmannia clavigera (strain kw1407 / UAMH 11150) TaxID=655863 RepID=F0XRC3_GROCL|nr:mitochondrial ribosomal protein [Grosmannia clavigera kw1407]EFW99906.1 mitochondrial ribosomal protein [Grosmannia clavigera kw1407]
MAAVSGTRRLVSLQPVLGWRGVGLGAAAASSAVRPLSTTAACGGPKGAAHVRGNKQVQMRKKKKAPPRGKTAEPGERKQLRRRIVLSNGNALAVTGLEELTASRLHDSDSVGRVLALPDGVVDQLRAVGAFKPSQSFSLFRRPSVLIRAETATVAAQMQQAAAARQTLRLVVDGDRIAGKSILLLQALAHGFMNDWVVFHIPEAHELTSASTDYAPLDPLDGQPPRFVQPAYMLQLLQAVQAASGPVLARHKTVRAYDRLQNPVAAGSTLLQLVAAARENDHAWPVFQALWSELTTTEPTEIARPPVLFALDGLAHVMGYSRYRDPAFEQVHAHDLALVRAFVDLLAGAELLPHGGAVIAATSRGNAPACLTLDLALARRLAEQDQTDAATNTSLTPPPYFRGFDDRVAAALHSVRVLRLCGLSRPEARSLMEYWAASGVLRDRVDEQAVAGTWSLAGNGLVGEMERTALLSLRP